MDACNEWQLEQNSESMETECKEEDMKHAKM